MIAQRGSWKGLAELLEATGRYVGILGNFEKSSRALHDGRVLDASAVELVTYQSWCRCVKVQSIM